MNKKLLCEAKPQEELSIYQRIDCQTTGKLITGGDKAFNPRTQFADVNGF